MDAYEEKNEDEFSEELALSEVSNGESNGSARQFEGNNASVLKHKKARQEGQR